MIFATTAPIDIQPERLTPIRLAPEGVDASFGTRPDGSIDFYSFGWYEVLLTVAWDPTVTDGTRFSHTKGSDGHPLHSEAVDASVLARISNGRQLLRGNAIFGDGHLDSLLLEVWHDVPDAIAIAASLRIRRLP